MVATYETFLSNPRANVSEFLHRNVYSLLYTQYYTHNTMHALLCTQYYTHSTMHTIMSQEYLTELFCVYISKS